MQIIKPLLGLSASPLGVVKTFDISNRLLLRKKSDFQLGSTNYIQPLGVRLLSKSPLLQYSKLLLPRQQKPVIDENICNSENWNFDTFANELETNVFLHPQEETPLNDNSLNSDSIENNVTTLITDVLPNTLQINLNNNVEENHEKINLTSIATTNVTDVRDISKDTTLQAKPTKKSKSKLKDTSETKSRTKKSSTNKTPKKSQKIAVSNLASEVSNLQLNDNELLLDSSPENQLEAKQELQNNEYIQSVTTQPLTFYPENNENTDISLKEIPNEEPILHPEVTTLFQQSQESENVVQAFVENTTSEPHFLNLDTKSPNKSINHLPTSEENSTIVEELNKQENLVKTEYISELVVQEIPIDFKHNNTLDKLDDSKNYITQDQIRDNLSVQPEHNLHNNEPNLSTELFNNEQIIPSAFSREVVNTVRTPEIPINNISGEQDINSEPAKSKVSVSPIIQTVIKDDVTDNQLPIIQETNSQTIASAISSVPEHHSTVQKSTQDDLKVNYPVSANKFPENPDTQNVPTLTNNQQIEPAEIPATNPTIEVSTGADISEVNLIQKIAPQDNSTDKITDNIRFNLKLNNLTAESINNTEVIDENTAIELRYLEDNENLVIFPEETSREIASSNIVDKSSETQTVENIADSAEISPKNTFDNLPNNLPAPTGYATGGLVASNTIDSPPIAPSDTVPAMLTPGEFVINARDSQKNINVLRHINSGGTLPEDITTPVTPNIEPVEETNTSFLQPSTLVDNSQTNSDIISPKLTPSSVSSPQNSKIRSPGISVPSPLQFNLFENSTENSTTKVTESVPNPLQFNLFENSPENSTTEVTENASHYSSPPLIFRQVNTNNTTKANNLNTSLPSQWESVEELLNDSSDEFTIFNFSNVNKTESINSHLDPQFHYSTDLQTPKISTKRLPLIQGFADGGEVTESDIATDIEPVTETIQRPADSNSSESSQEKKNENESPDLETLAREIYSRLRQRLEIERERYGMYSGRLPW
jgi:hypothetical protein